MCEAMQSLIDEKVERAELRAELRGKEIGKEMAKKEMNIALLSRLASMNKPIDEMAVLLDLSIDDIKKLMEEGNINNKALLS